MKSIPQKKWSWEELYHKCTDPVLWVKHVFIICLQPHKRILMDRAMLWPSLTDHKSCVNTNMLVINTSAFSLLYAWVTNVIKCYSVATWTSLVSWFKCQIHKVCCWCCFSPVIPFLSVHPVCSLTWGRSYTPPARWIPWTNLQHMRGFRQNWRFLLAFRAWRLLCAGFLLPF